MSDELKPCQMKLRSCPFCGGKAYIHEHYTFGGYVPNDYPHNEPLGYAIGCSKYDCRGKRENTGFMYDTEAEAIAAWNARADDAQIAANDNLPAETDISAEGHARNDMEMVDSRERLEADVYRAAEEMDRFYCGEKFIDTRKIIGWLDRQAAITKSESRGKVRTLRRQNKKYRKQIESLTAERDLLDQAYTAVGEACTDAETECGCLQDKVDELSAERDELRDELREKQHVCDVQRDSFLKLEAENAELRRMLADATEAI